jgi:hypothetical protein
MYPSHFNRIILYIHIYNKVREILRHLDVNKVVLPNGGNLSANRFLHLGLDFGMHGKCIVNFLLASSHFTLAHL